MHVSHFSVNTATVIQPAESVNKYDIVIDKHFNANQWPNSYREKTKNVASISNTPSLDFLIYSALFTTFS